MASPHIQNLNPDELINRYRSIDLIGELTPENTLAGPDDWENWQAYKNFKGIMGRDPSTAEFSKALPFFRGETGLDTGRAYVTKLREDYEKSPEYLRTKAPEKYDQVTNVFEDLVSRGATEAELEHFGNMLATGEIDEYTLRQFVSQLPEVKEAEATKLQEQQTEEDRVAREQLAGELEGYDQDFFNKARENVISRYARTGKLNSPSLDFALTNLMGDIQKNRSAYLADIARRDYESQRGFKREDYLRNKNLLREDYMANVNRNIGLADYERMKGDTYLDNLLSRAYNTADYNIQRRDMLGLLNSMNNKKQKSPYGQMIGSGFGTILGTYFGKGNPAAMAVGERVGSNFGSGFDYLR